jgi:ubiquinone/menaquinone biosynthesis C-methylase UbiE
MKQRYIPALSFFWLTPLYDPALRLLMREGEIKRALIVQMNLRSGLNLLDLGCGTGTLAILIAQESQGVSVTGLDGDSDVLNRAAAKAARAGVTINWNQGLATNLPYPPIIFDRTVSSLVFHHLTETDKARALREAHRTLRPGGELHLLDFGPPHDTYSRLAARIMRNFEETASQFDGRLPGMIRAAGFAEPEVCHRFTIPFGSLTSLRAVRL